MRKLLSCRYDDGLDIRSKPAVGIGNGPFSLKVDHIPYTSYYMIDAKLTTDVDCELIILNHPHSFQSLCCLINNLNSFLIWEESPLVDVHTHSYHNLIKHCKSPLQNVEMAGSKRIE